MNAPIAYADLDLDLRPVRGPLSARAAQVSAEQLVGLCQALRNDGGRLLTLWGADNRDQECGFALHVVLQDSAGLLVLCMRLNSAEPCYPDLSQIFPCADRLQRAAYDLIGIRATGGGQRPWLQHAAWPQPPFPLQRQGEESAQISAGNADYAFVRVEGDGVHEIAVGPVHAGIIEPGHFRFSVVGEKVLRLEERLGYVHKGIEKRFQGMALTEGVRLAARISGDSAIAFAWAYAMAVESLTATTVPDRALSLRALLLERERIANHLGDLGALGNDAGLAFGLTQFSRLKEDFLRVNAAIWGQRYLMDAIVPGGVHADLTEANSHELIDSMRALETEVQTLREIYDNHAGLQDRFMGTGRVGSDLVDRMGVIGLAARASGSQQDWRRDMPVAPYDRLKVRLAVHAQGDVAARVAVRFDELVESLRLCRTLLQTLPAGPVETALGSSVVENELGIGGVEGWRGPVFIALQAEADGRIRRCHPHDPSWQNWPVLEYAVIDNIVPDFPLINKSFNLSYSGHDL